MVFKVKNINPLIKRVVILQPGYLPWLGCFDQLHKCDIYVLLDDVQFTKNDWRNRNRIKTKHGLQWLTIPVIHKFGQIIKDTVIVNNSLWNKKHLQALKTWYGKSRFFKEYIAEIEEIYSKKWNYLIDIDIALTVWLKGILNITCETKIASEMNIQENDRQLRLIEICRKLNCKYIYEGKSGQNYIDEDLFKRNEILIEYQDYKHPYYNQLWIKEQGFISHLSIIDLLFNYGTDSLNILTGKIVIARPEGIKVRHADEVLMRKMVYE
jgi:hypothetical protein